MNSLVPAQFGQVSSKFASVPVTNDLSAGVQASFGLIGYKGKVWTVRYRGEEHPQLRDDGDGAKNSIEVVIIKAASVVSKIWYEEGYVEGSTAPPDCYSNNGIRPEAASMKPQSETCAVCPRNQWGSRITPAGKQGKDCADSKRLAVVPMDDMQNEIFGGPMLLRVPAASLGDMAMYGDKMAQMGYPYFAIATRISFDTNEAYPKFLFNAIRPLSDDEADVVIGWQESNAVQRILSESEFAGSIAGGSPAHHEPVFEQQPVTTQPATKQPATKPKPTTPAGGKPNGAAVTTVGQQARAAAAKTAPKSKEETPAQTKVPTPAEIAAARKAAAIEAAKAALAAAEAEAAAMEDEEVTSEVNEEEGGDEAPSDFEQSLDAALSKLLPT